MGHCLLGSCYRSAEGFIAEDLSFLPFSSYYFFGNGVVWIFSEDYFKGMFAVVNYQVIFILKCKKLSVKNI
jgi:hypothetical protein